MLLHLAPGTKEDTERCRAFFQELKRRGLPDPLLVATEGAPGLIRAVEECFPRSHRQRCLAHRSRNLKSKVTEAEWPEFRVHANGCYEAPSLEMARALRQGVVETKNIATQPRSVLTRLPARRAHPNLRARPPPTLIC